MRVNTLTQEVKDNVKHILEPTLGRYTTLSSRKNRKAVRIMYNGKQVYFGRKGVWLGVGPAKLAIRSRISIDFLFTSIGSGNYRFHPTNEIVNWNDKRKIEDDIYDFIYKEIFTIEEI